MMQIPVSNCSSCAACANVCARGAISMTLDQNGFYRPTIDASKCIACGACERACPVTKNVKNPNGSTESPQVFAAYAADEKIRTESSSGGVFSVLAQRVLKDGGAVVGVAQLGKTHFGHIIAEDAAGLEKLRGSKYVQADAGNIYRDVRTLLRTGREVLFSGTPCQVAGLYAVLGKTEYPNLVTVDIVCHGSPSVNVFEKYIRELETERSVSVLSSRFRDKRNGWRLFSMAHRAIEYSSGDCFQIFKTLREDKFMRVFLQNLCLNDSCADCHYGKIPRVADITLGDYWNIRNFHPELDDDRGTSLVLLNTEHGQRLFDEVRPGLRLCASKAEYAILGNPCLVRSSVPHPDRSKFFADLDSKTLDELIRKYCPYPGPFKRAYMKMRHILGAAKRRLAKKLFGCSVGG